MKKYCFVGYSKHKNTLWEGSFVSPNLDSDILGRDASEYTSICIGDKIDRELVPSQYISTKVNPFRVLASLFRSGPICLKDIIFLSRIYRPNEFYKSWVPLPRSLWMLWVIRNFVIARHFAVLFGDIAKNHSEARVIGYYNAAMLGVVYAFRKLGKPVYEIQHGYIGPSHNAYNDREIVGSKSNFCPSGFVVWSERVAHFLKSLGGRNIEIAGFRHLRNFAAPARSEKVNILFTAQPQTELPEYIVDLINEFNDITWRIRIHPRELAERGDIESLQIYPNVEICDRQVPLASDLLQCNLHFTVHSSAVFEAAEINVVTIFTHELGMERFQHEISEGMAIFVDAQTAAPTIRSLLKNVHECLSKTETPARTNVRE